VPVGPLKYPGICGRPLTLKRNLKARYVLMKLPHAPHCRRPVPALRWDLFLLQAICRASLRKVILPIGALGS
jgi:hypothetical protein